MTLLSPVKTILADAPRTRSRTDAEGIKLIARSARHIGSVTRTPVDQAAGDSGPGVGRPAGGVAPEDGAGGRVENVDVPGRIQRPDVDHAIRCARRAPVNRQERVRRLPEDLAGTRIECGPRPARRRRAIDQAVALVTGVGIRDVEPRPVVGGP